MTNYDEHGNQIRSRPLESFYQKWWFWLMLTTVIIAGFIVFGAKKDVEDSPDKTADAEEIEADNLVVDNEEKSNASRYTYEDFKGTYAKFQSDPYQAGSHERHILEDNFYKIDDFWEFGLEAEIINKEIKGNILTLEYHVKEDLMNGLEEEIVTEKFELQHDGNMKSLYSLTNDQTIYSISKDDLQNHYSQLEIDYARIIMTIIGGNIPLDGWAMAEPATLHVSHSNANEPLGDWGGAPSYPVDVTHLSGNLLETLSYLSELLEGDSITYSTTGDGNITIYQLDKEGAEKVSQEKIIELESIYVDPSEPYFVADFIGRVEFIYD